jgi:hypothetical protein
MNVEEVVKGHLVKNGYDGLYCDNCSCTIDELFCNCYDNICAYYEYGYSWYPPNECVAGYLHRCIRKADSDDCQTRDYEDCDVKEGECNYVWRMYK